MIRCVCISQLFINRRKYQSQAVLEGKRLVWAPRSEGPGLNSLMHVVSWLHLSRQACVCACACAEFFVLMCGAFLS